MVNKARAEVSLFIAECTTDVANAKAISFILRHRNALRIGMFAITFMFMLAAMVFGNAEVIFAAQTGVDGVANRISTTLSNMITVLRNLSAVACALVLIICFLVRMGSKNQRSVDEATTWMKRAGISLVCILLVGTIISFLMDIAGTDVAIPTVIT